jgi:hypothetical protein
VAVCFRRFLDDAVACGVAPTSAKDRSIASWCPNPLLAGASQRGAALRSIHSGWCFRWRGRGITLRRSRLRDETMKRGLGEVRLKFDYEDCRQCAMFLVS